MNKADIIAKVHEVLGTSKADAERAVECVIDNVTATLKKGDEVSIAGLGIFLQRCVRLAPAATHAPERASTFLQCAYQSSVQRRHSRTQ
jgi:Bacterial DNA-binding protein